MCVGRLLSIAEETVTEFISKATGTAIDWIQLPGMKVCHDPQLSCQQITSTPSQTDACWSCSGVQSCFSGIRTTGMFVHWCTEMMRSNVGICSLVHMPLALLLFLMVVWELQRELAAWWG